MQPADGRPRPRARVLSWLGDWAVVAAWLLLLTLVSVLLPGAWRSEVDPASSVELLRADLVVMAVTVLPFLLYLVAMEASSRHATVGKRWTALQVQALEGGSPTTGAVWVRNLVKVLPWQLAHLAVSRLIFEVQFSAAIVLDLLALTLLALIAVPALTGGQGLHDRLAGTAVRRDATSPEVKP